MPIQDIAAVILTLNEAPNIGRVLAKLKFATDIVVIDSGSTDQTLSIVGGFPRTRVLNRTFTTHAEQWNFGLDQVRSEWVLALDADFVLSDALIDEIALLTPAPDVAGYRAQFVYCIDGKPLRGAVYPPVTVLFRRTHAKYEQEGHTQRVRMAGRILNLNNPLYHDDRKSLRRWFDAQCRYMRLEADMLVNTQFSDLKIQDCARKLIVIAPLAMFLYCMFVKGNILDGRAGLFYALQRSIAEGILSLYLLQSFSLTKPGVE